MTERFDDVLAMTYDMEDALFELHEQLDEGRLAVDSSGLDRLHRDLIAHHTELKHMAHKYAEEEPHEAEKWHAIAKAHGRKAYMHKVAKARLD